ncbi:hypothetical protein JCM10449v2_000134 [Rhodotorula kratochvilovae]
MGFCGRCGEPVHASTRCKCGGLPRESATKALFDGKGSDRWTQSYTTRSPKNASPTRATFQQTSGAAGAGSFPDAPNTRIPQSRPASPTKLSQSFIHDDGELHSVFGSVLSPQDRWQCAGCETPFKQEEKIYPHPDAKKDVKAAETFFCRNCFAERFRVGDCKACKQAVLTDAPFVKHESTVWHEDPSSPPVIDLSGRPVCERCFDAPTAKTRIIPPSPQPTQGSFFNKPVSVPPAPSKWGRPSLPSGASSPPKKGSVWSAKQSPQVKSSASGLGIGSQSSSSGKTGLARLRLERDKSPIAPSLDELGDKLRRAGLEDSPRSRRPTKEGAAPPSPIKARPPLPLTPSSASLPPSPVKAAAAAWPPRSPSPTKSTFPTSPRPVLAPLQPRSPSTSSRPLPSPLQRPASPLKPASPTKPTASLPASPTKSSARIAPAAAPAAQSEDDETCPVCARPLGYGDFVELGETGKLMHADCFRCGGCGKTLGAGKYVETEGKCWHQECAPAPKRYRALVTSLAEPEPAAPHSSSPSPAPLTAELTGDNPSCHRCGRPLGYGHSVTVPRSGHSFHQRCFTCASCGKPFGAEKGERGFIEVDGQPYHQKCAPPPAAPSPRIANSPFFAADSRTLPSSRSTRPLAAPSFPPRHLPNSPSQTRVAPSIFSRRERPPSNLGGLLICAGCSARSTEKETVVGPRNTRFHPKCLVCRECARPLDSECRVGEDGALRCEACRKAVQRRSYRDNTVAPPSPTKPHTPVRRL